MTDMRIGQKLHPMKTYKSILFHSVYKGNSKGGQFIIFFILQKVHKNKYNFLV